MDHPQTTSTRWAQPIRLRMRADLVAVRQGMTGRHGWRLKDPISLRYFDLTDEEYVLLKMLDGKVTMERLKAEIERQFPPRLVSYEQLQALLHRFFALGLIYGEGAAQTEAAQKAARSQFRNRWVGQVVNPLFIKFPGVDPEPALRWLYPRIRWMFGRILILICLVLIGTAAIVVATQFTTFSSSLPALDQLFQASNLVWLFAALAVSKTLHELGHAIACKHFGGECHEIGPALFLFAPCLYCDTTDAWMIASKWQRAAVGAAGIAVELVLASACVIVWHFSQPGLIHYLCLNTVLVCSISTLVFNANPLVRFDGYYILSDLAGVPNLWPQSRAALLRLLQVGTLGLSMPAAAKPLSDQIFLVGYAIASLTYRWALVLGIIVYLSKALRPYGLQVVGSAMLLLTLLGMFALPVWKIWKFFTQPGIWRRVRFLRTAVSSAVILLLLVGILYVPIPHHVEAPLILEYRTADRVYVTVPGTLKEVFVEHGDRVAPGAPIARLANLEIDQEIARLSGERDRQKIHLQNLTRRQGHDKDAANAIPATRVALADLDERLRRRQLDAERLTLVSRQAGIVSPPPPLSPPPPAEDALPTWSGLPCDSPNLGCFLDVGTLMILVGEPEAMDALLIVDQNDIEFVRPLQYVDIKLNEYRAETLVGQITQVAKIDLEKVPIVLSHKSGGELSTVTDESGAERPLRVAYQARVPLPETGFPVLPGFHGRAKIDVGSEPLGRRLIRAVRQTFMF